MRAVKESHQARGTHVLGNTDRGTSQVIGRKWASKGHSLSGERRNRDKSGYRKKGWSEGYLPTRECRATSQNSKSRQAYEGLTNWRE